MASPPPEPRLTIERIYLRDVSFESPQAPAIFAREWQPQVQVDINARNQALADAGAQGGADGTGEQSERFEVVLTLTLEAKHDDVAAMIVEVQQAGIFRLQSMDAALREHVLATACPAALFPYLRETLDSLAVKGSFPPIQLAPVNFEALYAEAKRRWDEQNASDAAMH